jgi:MFS family permease
LLALLGLFLLDSAAGRFLFTAGQGLAGGMFVALSTVLLPRFFGRAHLGAISGVNYSIMVFASAIGPILFSLSFTITNSYRPILLICALIPVILIFISYFVQNPQLKYAPSQN